MTERIHVEDASAHSKLSRLIDIVHHAEAKVAQLMLYIYYINILIDCEADASVIQHLLAYSHFSHSFRMSDDVERLLSLACCKA